MTLAKRMDEPSRLKIRPLCINEPYIQYKSEIFCKQQYCIARRPICAIVRKLEIFFQDSKI
jgi:hypothetical protein